MAKQRLADFLREEHRKAEAMDRTKCGKFTFAAAVELFLTRLLSAKDLKPRSEAYIMERLAALQRSWRISITRTSEKSASMIARNGRNGSAKLPVQPRSTILSARCEWFYTFRC
jgi:hypothetical protein